VTVGLEMPGELALDDLDLGQPLHRRYRIPPGHDESKREAVLNGQRLAVHRVGQQHLCIPGDVDAEAPLEADALGASANRAAVGTSEDDLARFPADAGPVEDFGERNPRPLGGARRAEAPLLTLDLRAEQ